MTDLYILVCSFLYCHFSNNNKITISIAIIKYFSSVSHCISYKKTVTHHCFGTKMMPWFSGTNSQFCQISRSLFCCCSVAQSCLTLRPHGAQHPRIPCASLSHWVCSNSHPLSWWHYPTISSSVTPCSFCPQSFPASGSFPMSQLFALGGLSIGASASVLPMSIQGLFPLGLIGLISLLSKGLLRVFSSTTICKHEFFGAQPSLWSNSHIHNWLLEKPGLWLAGPVLAKWCLCFVRCCISWS